MIGPNNRYSHHPDVAWRLIQDEALLVDPHSGSIFPLNPVAARIWVLLGEGLLASEVVHILSVEFEAPPETLRNDAWDFIARLLEANLLIARSDQQDSRRRE